MAAEDRTQFTIDVEARASSVAAAAEKVAQFSSALEQSAAALATSNDAVRLAESKYRQAEIAADRAAKAVERLGASGGSGDAFAKRQAIAAEKALEAGIALQREAAALDAVKSKAATAAASHDALKKGLAQAKSAADEAAKAEKAAAGTGNLRSFASGLGKIGGPAGDAGRQLFGLANAVKKIGTSLGAVGPFVAGAVAIIAIATAATIATVAIGKWAVGLADASRTNSLLAQGVARSVAGGELLDGTISDLGRIVPQTREELLAMAGQLADTGLRGKALSDALEVAAVKAAKLKFGPDFAAQMKSLPVQARRFHDNIAETFGGLKIEKLLDGVSTLVALFDSSTASGRALKFLFETMFQPLVDGAAGAIPKIERLFLYAEILALKAFIALKPYSGAIKLLGEGFLIAAAVLVGTLAVAVVAVGAIMAGIFLGPIILLGALIAAVIKAAGAIRDGFGSALAYVKDLGTQMVQGLVDGITGGATAVVNAMKNVVGGAVDAAKHALGIASPSKVFAGIGDYAAQGFAEGVEGGFGDAQASIDAMVSPRGGTAPVGRGSSSVQLTVQNVNVNGANAKEQALDFLQQVTRLLELDALSVGGGEVPASG